MRLTTLILIATIMQVSASGYSQSISLNIKNASLNDVIKEISKQSGYEFFYNRDLIEKTKPITINIKNSSLQEALAKCFINQPFTFEIQDKVVYLKPKTSSVIKNISETLSKLFTEIGVNGNIIDEKGNPLVGATVKVKYTNNIVLTNERGYFSLKNVADTATLVVSYIGYRTKEIPAYQAGPIIISLELETSVLESVNVVSTGYQTLPKERATGSFEKIDNQLFNRVTSTDILSRINGTVPGVYFNNSNTLNAVSIRGISSLSEITPLIVLDNIPYDGDINNINPNDVDNITILKDAAAASIWGTRAGNGVIVITTKKGKYEKPLELSLNTNFSVSKKPDLFYIPQISSSDFIDVEKFLFSNGYYDEKLNTTDPYIPFVTPVVSLLAKQKAGYISPDQASSQIDAMRKYDVRNDYLKYIYRPQFNQQYAVNLNGGSKQVSYFVSAGYDKNLNGTINSDYDRVNLRSNIEFKPFKNLDVQTGVLYTLSKSNNVGSNGIVAYNQGILGNIYPYARLADDSGNPNILGVTYDLDYLNTLSKNPKLLDWRYKPLEDINKSQNIGNSQDILFNLGTKYTFNPVFSFDLKYQYQRTNSKSEEIYNADSYFSRDLINIFTTPANYTDPLTGLDASYIRNIPVGGVYSSGNSISTNQTLRGLINADKTWNEKHHLVAIAGAEIRKTYGVFDNEGTRYGYNSNLKTFQTVNYLETEFPYFYGGVSNIPYGASLDDSDNRFTSYFANASYTYNNRYIVSGSVRKDASNVFGVNSNKRGAPLWSAGLAWNISQEPFYKFSFLPYLKLRATYGYSGTTVSGTPAFAVVTHNVNPTTLLPFIVSRNLPNPDLRWEKSGMLNLGVDFGLKKSVLNGSIEYFDKRSTDLLAQAPLNPTTGFITQTFNTANLHGKGVDLSLNATIIHSRLFSWNTTLNLSYNKIIVTKYLLKPSATSTYVTRPSGLVNAIPGEEAYVVYALPSVGLDPDTGDPRGYLNGQISKDYTSIFNGPLSSFKNMGSSRPRYYGSFRNTFNYGQLSMSANIFYKFDYVFRRNGLNYTNLFYSNIGDSEFSRRWQHPGDESRTNVPSMIYPFDTYRDLFYNFSDAVIEKGDHIRLQDVTASYNFNKVSGFRNLNVYANVSNLGIIWRANKKGIDPDVSSGGYPNPLTFSFGISATFN